MTEEDLFSPIKQTLIEQHRSEEDIAKIEEAYNFAKKVHGGQFRVSGEPYIIHPVEVLKILLGLKADTHTLIEALLHDVIEDTDWTIDDLEKEGFNEDILTALKLMTHNPAEPYMDYISRLSTCPVARQVKLADLYHNSDRTRVENPDEKMLKRWEKYDRAIQLLKSVNIH